MLASMTLENAFAYHSVGLSTLYTALLPPLQVQSFADFLIKSHHRLHNPAASLEASIFLACYDPAQKALIYSLML